jgi:DNA-binding transcriptional MerR regulator
VKKEITISELAALMGVSTHQIRYFEEKRVLCPAYIGDNHYRMYGMNQLYQLAHVLLLRKLGLSVQAIREWMENGTADGMQRLLRQSAARVEAEIEQLRQLGGFIANVLEDYEQFGQEHDVYQITDRNALPLSCWVQTEASAGLDARLLIQQGNRLAELHETDLHYVFDSAPAGSLRVCTETDEPDAELVLPAGSYLSCRFTARSEEEVSRQTERLAAYAKEHSLSLQGPLVLTEKSYLSLFTRDCLHYELFRSISKKKSERT